MWLPADLGDMFDGSDDDRLPARLAALRARALEAVPSIIDVRIVITGSDATLANVTLERDDVPLAGARASLRAMLPRPPGAEFSITLLLFASEPDAFRQLAADWAAILDMDPRRLVLDQDLGSTPVVEVLEASVIDQAVGVLLDRGLLPDEGRAELARLAGRDGISLEAAARGILDGLR